MRYTEFLAALNVLTVVTSENTVLIQLTSCACSRSSGDADRSIEDVGEDERHGNVPGLVSTDEDEVLVEQLVGL